VGRGVKRMLVSDGVMSRVPRTHAHKNPYLECRCGFHMGVGAGGPNFTHGLPVTSTIYKTSLIILLASYCWTSTMSATLPLAVDVSRHVHNPSVDSYEPTCHHMTCCVASSGVDSDHHQDHEELVETSIRCSLSSPQPPCTHGRHITMSVTSRSTKDMSNGVHDPSVGLYKPTQQDTTHCYASSSIAYQRNDEVDEDMSYRHVSSYYLPPSTSRH